MSGIDDRRKGMEAKLHRDDELRFKVHNRRNKLLGLWAAEQFGLTGDEAAEYAKQVVMSDFEETGDEDVLRKVLADFQSRGVSVEKDTVRKKMDDLLEVAHDQIVGEAG
jgi:hypothetical protein